MRALSALLGVVALLPACDADSGDASADAAPAPDAAPRAPDEDVPPLDGMPPPPDLRMNHVRVRGTHNSYHLKPDNILPDWQYEHLPLDQQLETQHVRQFELDVHFKDDGFHVYHLPGVDAGSTCDRFVDCLAVLRGWSESHPGHVPIIVLVEPKDDVDNKTGQVLTAAQLRGREIFGQQCQQCHTLRGANAVGKVGPNLDQLRPTKALVLNAVAIGRVRGAGTMPAQLVRGQDAQDVADFVSAVAGRD